MKMLDHCNARTGRADDRLGVCLFKDLNKPLGKLFGFVPIASIKCGLSAACLALIKNEFASDTP